MTPIAAQSYYAIAADQGTWEKVAGFNGQSAVFKNPAATSVIVTALPHNTKTPPASGQIGPMMAWKTLEPYACLKTVDTKLLLPTPATSVTVGGQSVTLGYDPVTPPSRANFRSLPRWYRGLRVSVRKPSPSSSCFRIIARR
jgi:hypothetical protein